MNDLRERANCFRTEIRIPHCAVSLIKMRAKLLKNHGLSAGVVLTLTSGGRTVDRPAVAYACARPAASESVSSFGMAAFGMEQTHSRDLPRIDQVPIDSNPDHKEFGSRFRWHGNAFGMTNRQRFAIGEVQLEGAKGGPVPDFPELCDFHVSARIVTECACVFKSECRAISASMWL